MEVIASSRPAASLINSFATVEPVPNKVNTEIHTLRSSSNEKRNEENYTHSSRNVMVLTSCFIYSIMIVVDSFFETTTIT